MTTLLDVRNLTVSIPTQAGTVHAVTDVSYTLEQGESLGIVGESGSGKSLHVLAMLGLLPKTARVSGSVLFEGEDLLSLTPRELAEVRGRTISMVFQDPMTSLNPVLTVGLQICEVLERHLAMTRRAARTRAIELLDLVGVKDASRRVDGFPHEFSGGMRQRVMIAIALACEPRLLIADEATTALDVTVQAQVLDLVRDLRQRLGMAIIWITHDMGVVAGLAHTIQVMYAGRVMERGPSRAVFHDPRSAYTWSLLKAIPRPDQAPTERLHQIEGQPPNPMTPLPGDPFAPRNPFASERCFQAPPPMLREVGDVPGHKVAAWYDLPRLLAPSGSNVTSGSPR